MKQIKLLILVLLIGTFMSCSCGSKTKSTKRVLAFEIVYVVDITYTDGNVEQHIIVADIVRKDVPYIRLVSKDRALPCVDLYYDRTNGSDRDIACGVRKFKLVSTKKRQKNKF